MLVARWLHGGYIMVTWWLASTLAARRDTVAALRGELVARRGALPRRGPLAARRDTSP